MPLRNNNFSSAMQIVLVFALTVLLILLSVFNAVSSTTTVSLTNTNHLHNRRSLHQPFFPSTIVADPVHPPSPSPQPQPTRPLYKHPTTTTTTSSDPTTTTASPFFPVYQAPPPPSPPPPPPPSPSSDNNYAALPTFPANISSLVVPNSHHSSPSSSHSPPSLKLIIISVILCLLAVVLLISLALLHRRHRHRYQDGPFKPTNEIDSPPSDDVRLYPSDSASSDIHPLPPNPKPFRPNTSAEFLYLGTIASTHSREFEHTNVETHLESPEIRPLPPLPRKGHHLSGHQANPYPDTDTSGGEEGNQRVVRHYQSNDDEEDAVESFYSPVGSPDRLRRLSSTSSRRAIEVLERDIYLENQNCSSYSPISTSSSLSNSKQWEPSSIPVNLNSHTSNPSSPGGMSTPSPMEVRLPTLRHPINHSREFGGNGKESGLSKLFKEEIERPATTTDTDYSKAKEQVLPPQPPPPPPPPVFVRTESKPGPPPLPRPWRSFSSGEQERVRSGEVSKPKLKPLHWDNFWTSSDRAMVWDQLKSGSFQFNEELIEKLFGVNGPTAKRLNMYSSDQEYRVLDPKKSQNLSIILRASNVNVEMVYDVLVEGNTEILGSELLECLLRIKPTKEEESKLKECRDDSPAMLGPAEKFLKAIINIPFAYKRMEAMLYVAKFDSETEYLRKSFDTLEIACEELKNSRMFLKLLEAVLNTGNRMNNGTIRGDARAFKLDTLLKLVYIKGTDGKTTLLHFVVYEIIKSEGCRFSEPDNEDSRRTSLQDDIDTRKRGLEIIAGLGSELTNVKKAAAIDYKTLGIDVGRLANGLVGVEEVVKLSEQLEADNGLNNGKTARSMRFRDSMSGFLKKAKEEIRMIGAKERCSLVKVKEVTEYFHGNSVEEESHPLRIFVVVRDFLLILDKVCKEVGKLNERKVVSASHTVPMPVAVAAPGE